MKKIISSSLIIYLLIISSCKSVETFSTDFQLNENTYKKILDKNAKENVIISFDTRFTINNQEKKLSGEIEIYKDEEFIVKIKSKSIGVELIRIFCKNDSIVLLNRLKKEYYTNLNLPKEYTNFVNLSMVHLLFNQQIVELFNCNNKIFSGNKVSIECNDKKQVIKFNKKSVSEVEYLSKNEFLIIKYKHKGKELVNAEISGKVHGRLITAELYNIYTHKNRKKSFNITIPSSYK